MKKNDGCGQSVPISFTLLLRIMKLGLIFLVVLNFSSFAITRAQEKRVSLSMENAELHQVLKKFKRQTGVRFFYNGERLKKVTPKKVNIHDLELEKALEEVLEGTDLTWSFWKDVVVIKDREENPEIKAVTEKEKHLVKGTVRDEKGESLPGVSVLIKGTSIGTATDIDGRFIFSIPVGKYVLLFSMVGMESKEIVIDNNKEISEIVVVLKLAKNELEDVVVTGIFKKNKESYTGAVSTITEKELKTFGNKNLLTTIGNIDPSFNILSNNEMGSNPNYLPDIQIRGAASLPNLEELQDNSKTSINLPLIVLDGFEITLERMMDLDANEVASITLLKDGTSTAIYGSRGANGVVVITTKEPEMGKLALTYNGSVNIEVPDLTEYRLLNAKDKLELEQLSGYYESYSPSRDYLLKTKYTSILADVERGVNTYWLSKPLRTGVGHRHNLRLEGGDKSFRYSASIQYNNVAGVMKDSDRNNFNAGITLTYHHEKLIFQNALTIGLTKSNDSPYGSFSDYTQLNPYWKPYDDNGKIVKLFDNDTDYWGGLSSLPRNPLYNATLHLLKQQQYTNITDNFSIEWRPFEGFIARGRAGISTQSSESDDFKPAQHTDFESEQYKTDSGIFRKGRYNYGTSKTYDYDFALTLNYSKIFADKHLLYIGLNVDLTQKKYRNYNFVVEGFVEETLDFLSAALQYQENGKPTGSENITRWMGIVGNLNYSFDDRYYVDFAYRTDGSSQFGKDKKFAPFYSAGIGWNIHNEKFMKSVDFIDRLKLRTSYGQTGSQNFSAYQAISTYSYYLNDRYYQWMGAYQKALDNPNLEWQKTDKYNLGIEINTFNNCLNFIADFYLEKTSNLLSSLELPLSNGFTSYVENIGKVENRGYELKATGFLIRDTERRLIWTLTGSLVHNQDKIVKLSDVLKSEYSKRLLEGGILPNKVLREGESQNSIYAVRSMGIDPSTGREMFLKQNGEISYTWDANDRVYCGVSEPKYRGNFSTMFRWRDLSINLSFAYRLGGQLYNSTLASKVENADKRYNVDERVFTDRWQKTGDQTLFKGLNNESSTYATTRFVQDERTLIGQNLYISYEFLNNPWLQKHLGIQTLTLSGDLSDLFYWSTIKQERGLSYPFSRRFSFSLSMRF